MLIAALIIVCTVVAAFLARLALFRWTDCRSWSFARTVITWAALVSATGFVVLTVICLYEWVEQNGLALRGICPGGPPDIGAHLCTVSEFAANYWLSPFSLPGFAAILLAWALLWCLVWCVSSLFERRAERSRLRHVLRALAAGASAWLLAIVMSVLTHCLPCRCTSHSIEGRSRSSARETSCAWALPASAADSPSFQRAGARIGRDGAALSQRARP